MIFNATFRKSFQDVVYYKILGRQKWRHFEHKAKFEKMASFFRSKKTVQRKFGRFRIQ